MVGRTAIAMVLAAACGCGGVPTGPSTAPEPQLPELGGRPVYDRPLAEADPAVGEAWRTAQGLLSERLPAPPPEATMAGYARWLREVLSPWIAERSATMRALGEDLVALAQRGPTEGLFATVLYATIHEDVISQVRSLPVPPELRSDPERATIFRDALARTVHPLAQNTAEAWRRCVELAPGAPPVLHGWGEECARRAQALESLPAPEPRPSLASVPRAPDLPAECEGESSYDAPEAPPPDEAYAREVAVLYTGDTVTGADRERLLEAVHGKLGATLELPIVPRREMRRYEALHAEGRLEPRAPVCGQAPPLPAIVARRHPNLVLAHVSAGCMNVITTARGRSGSRSCELTVSFRRAGTDDRDGLPDSLSAVVEPVEGSDPPADAWIAAAERLGEPDRSALVGVLGGLGPVAYRVLGHDGDDPWLRVAPTLHGDARERILACLPEPGIAVLDLAWTITPTGGTRDAAVALHTPPAGDPDAARRCVEQVLEELAWPCTPSGEAERVEARICVGRAAE